MKTLDILIPQYKETDEIIKPLLNSIALQQCVDFNNIGVIITNDGTDVKLSKELLNSYPFKVQYLNNEHKGVSATRQYCLEHSKADYVMFCDADDLFCNVCGLYVVFNEINNSNCDGIISVFMEETRDKDNKPVFINRGDANNGGIDGTFVHGKIYRRQYLVDNNIRWNEKLTIHEDSYFNCLCQKLSTNMKYCPIPFYLWKWRGDSVCRHDKKYILKTYNNMLDSNTELVNELISRNKENDASFYAISMIYDAYFTMNKDEWLNQENQEYRAKTEKRFSKYYQDFKHLLNKVDIQTKSQIIMGIKNRFFQEGLLMESITFDSWIAHIEEMEV